MKSFKKLQTKNIKINKHPEELYFKVSPDVLLFK